VWATLLVVTVLLAACQPIAAPPAPTAVTEEINGIDLYYEIHGQGAPLILIHGGLGNAGYWSNQIPALAEHYQVIALDSRGHGRSSFDERPISYALMTEDVLALMDRLGIDKADVVGWSDGGIIGLELAINHPERVNKIVAYGANYDPSGVRSDIGESERFNAYIEQAAGDYSTLSPAPERWDEFLNNIGNMWATEPVYTPEQLSAITTPMLILDGKEEEAIDTDHTKAMADLIPGAELRLIPATGHFAMWDKPEEFTHIVLDYLGR
jgi:pimeloyl-ACP methyl ester carboxylesterase